MLKIHGVVYFFWPNKYNNMSFFNFFSNFSSQPLATELLVMALNSCLVMLRDWTMVIWRVFCFPLGNFTGYMRLVHQWYL